MNQINTLEALYEGSQAVIAAPWSGYCPPAPRRRQRLDPSKYVHIAQQYEAGTPTTVLTKRYGLGKGSVLRILAEAGVTMRRQPMADHDVTIARLLYESGQSLEAVGLLIGRDHSTVWRALLAVGVPMRDTHGRKL